MFFFDDGIPSFALPIVEKVVGAVSVSGYDTYSYDYGIVGDMDEVCDAMIAQLKAR